MFAAGLLIPDPVAIAAQQIRRALNRKGMQRMAEETGGLYFEVSRSKPIGQIYSEIEDEMRNQYSIAYKSDRTDASNGYRKISLTTLDKSLTARTRPGYYPH
jgi:VWFA-related protein